MTQDQILQLLEKLWGNYPNYKGNPNEALESYERAFGDADAGVIFKAARVHMDKSPFFPTPADIKKNINKGQMIYGENKDSIPAVPIKKISEANCPLNDHHCILLGDLCNGAEDGKCPFEGL